MLPGMTTMTDRWESDTRDDALACIPMASMQELDRVEWELNHAVWLSEHDVQWVALADDMEVL